MKYLVVSKKKIHETCKGGIEKSVPRDYLVPIGDPQGQFFYPTLTLTMDSYYLIASSQCTSVQTCKSLHCLYTQRIQISVVPKFRHLAQQDIYACISKNWLNPYKPNFLWDIGKQCRPRSDSGQGLHRLLTECPIKT